MRDWLAFLVAFALAFGGARAAAELAAGSAPSAAVGQGLQRPAATLVMPFDVTSGSETFLTASNVSGITRTGAADEHDEFDDVTGVGRSILGISTHWAFWDDNGELLADTFICLTLNDTVVVDPRNLASQDVGNRNVGATTDLSGRRGFAVVTAYATDARCRPPSETVPFPVPGGLIGAFTLADTESGSAFGHSAFGFDLDEDTDRTRVPDGEVQALVGTTLNPSSLERSLVILIALEEGGGAGEYADIELGPSSAPLKLAVSFSNNLEIPTSLPDVEVRAATFASVSQPGPGESSAPPVARLIPAGTEVESAGILRLEPESGLVGGSSGRFIVGFHGQALGAFGGGSALSHRQQIQIPGDFFETFCCLGSEYYECTGDLGALEECITATGTRTTCCSTRCILDPGRSCRTPTPSTPTPTATGDFGSES